MVREGLDVQMTSEQGPAGGEEGSPGRRNGEYRRAGVEVSLVHL